MIPYALFIGGSMLARTKALLLYCVAVAGAGVLSVVPALATAYDPTSDLTTGATSLTSAVSSVGSTLVVVVASVAALAFAFRWLRRVLGR